MMFDPSSLTPEQREKLLRHLEKKASKANTSRAVWRDLVMFSLVLKGQVSREKLPELNVEYAPANPSKPGPSDPLPGLLQEHLVRMKEAGLSTEPEAPLFPVGKKGQRISGLKVILRWNRALHECGLHDEIVNANSW